MRRFAFVVSYDGRPFHGWQSQTGGGAVQDVVEEAFAQLTRQDIRVTGSGRTDAGVSASGQVFHCDVDGEKWTPETLAKGVNHFLPSCVRIVRGTCVPADFHARHDVFRKIYRYRWIPAASPNTPFLPTDSPFRGIFSVQLDLAAMKKATALFAGFHDFSHFTVRKSCPDDARRTIDQIGWETGPAELVLWIAGRGFLHMMIRYIAQTLIHVGQGKRSPEAVAGLLLQGSSSPFPPLHPAPPEGLDLVRVLYGKREPFPPFSPPEIS